MSRAASRAAEMSESVHILGIETSCDETAAAVVRSGEFTESNVVLSQLATHAIYGGVVPELASREHLRGIAPVVRQALQEAGQSYGSLDAIAVTRGPGLAGSLLVGVSYAKALAFALEKPLIAVNHLEGHIHAVLLEEKQRGANRIGFPALALVVSGGHTHLFLCEPVLREPVLREPVESATPPESNRASPHAGGDQKGRRQARQSAARAPADADTAHSGWRYRLVGRTRDDAAGEAYDKVAKLLGLGYPGGPVIDRLAPRGNPQGVRFTPAQIKHRQRGGRRGPGAEQPAFDFSFSGIKTAVLRYVELNQMQAGVAARRALLLSPAPPTAEALAAACDQKTLDLIASFQRTVVEDLVGKTLRAAQEFRPASLLVTGGVAANSELRRAFEARARQDGLPVHFPSRPLSTDNAAMIAAAAYPRFLRGEFADPHFSAEASLALA